MSSGHETETVKARFYQKAYLAGLTTFAVGRREDSGERHPILRLHECLATISVAGPKEVIACYIEPATTATEVSSGHSKLHMSRNDKWEEPAKVYISRILGILANMSSASTSKTDELQEEVYAYCKQKVEQRIKKFLWTIDGVLKEEISQPMEELFPHDRDDWPRLREIVEVIKEDLERLQYELRAANPPANMSQQLPVHITLAKKSNSCRQIARDWMHEETDRYKGVLEIVKEKFPYIEKRMLKVASHSRSIDALSQWAKGVGEFMHYKQAFPVPTPIVDGKGAANGYIIYSTPNIEPFANVMGSAIMSWDAIAKQYYPNYATEDAIKKLMDLNPSLKNPRPPKMLYIHAEMHFVQSLLSLKRPHNVEADVYIGVSKLCCFLCYHYIRTVNENHNRALHICIKGTHNKLYNTWLLPANISDAELATLEIKLDAMNQKALVDPQSVINGTDESAPVSTLPPP